jgi:hypothetical protein
VPWKLVHNHPACRSGEWAVVNQQAEAEGRHSIEGCHGTRDEALAQQRALYAKEPQMSLRQLTVSIEQKDISDAGSGEITGLAAVYGNVDLQDDMVEGDAAKKTVSDWSRAKQRVPLLDWHGDSISRIIGSVKEMKSVPQGVWFRAGFTSDEQGQRARQLAKDGHLTGVSIGYQPIRQSMKMIGDRMVRVLHEIRIHEISLTPVPANPQAQLASVKSVEVATIGLDFDQFTIAARKAGELPDIAYKAAMAVLLDHYQPQAAELTEQAESTAEPATAAATTPPGPAGTAPDAAHAGTSPSVPLTPREYVDSVLQRVEQADGSPASLDQLEARIRQSLGGTT